MEETRIWRCIYCHGAGGKHRAGCKRLKGEVKCDKCRKMSEQIEKVEKEIKAGIKYSSSVGFLYMLEIADKLKEIRKP